MQLPAVIIQALFLLADEVPGGANEATTYTGNSGFELMFQHLVAAAVFAVVGVLILCLSFMLMNKLSPFSLKKEIEEDQNTALGIIMGSVVIGISIIIAAAIIG